MVASWCNGAVEVVACGGGGALLPPLRDIAHTGVAVVAHAPDHDVHLAQVTRDVQTRNHHIIVNLRELFREPHMVRYHVLPRRPPRWAQPIPVNHSCLPVPRGHGPSHCSP